VKVLVIIVSLLCGVLVAGAAFRLATMTAETEPLVDLGFARAEPEPEPTPRAATPRRQEGFLEPVDSDTTISGARVREMENTADFVGGGSSSPSTGGTEYNATGAVNRAKKGVEQE
jgi:hypothetical protein